MLYTYLLVGEAVDDGDDETLIHVSERGEVRPDGEVGDVLVGGRERNRLHDVRNAEQRDQHQRRADAFPTTRRRFGEFFQIYCGWMCLKRAPACFVQPM